MTLGGETAISASTWPWVTFNIPCEVLGVCSGDEVRGCRTKVGGINPLSVCRKRPARSNRHYSLLRPFYCRTSRSIHGVINSEDRKLFSQITQPRHCLHHLLPHKTSTHCPYSLRKRQHYYQLPHVEYSQYKNSFITRCLFNFRRLSNSSSLENIIITVTSKVKTVRAVCGSLGSWEEEMI